MSIFPKQLFITFFALISVSFSKTFASRPIALPPLDLIRSTTAPAASLLMSRTAILWPFSESASANLPHKTPPAPVNKIVLFILIFFVNLK